MIRKLESLEKRLQSLDGARININSDSPVSKDVSKMLRKGTVELKKGLNI